METLARDSEIVLKNNRFLKSLWACASFAGRDVCLAFPQTFMNLSGEAVVLALKKKKISVADLLIVSDDVSLPLGEIRIKARGSAGGHNGIQSVIERLGTSEFSRLRLGIGSPSSGQDLADYVLSPFSAPEEKIVKTMLVTAAMAMETWAVRGTDMSMNLFNSQARERE